MNKINTKLSYIIQIPEIKDEALLSFAEGKKHIPFKIKRFYFIHEVDNNATRGKHAHRKNKQVLFCLKGSVKVLLDNGTNKEEIILNKSNEGVFLNKIMWHEMSQFTKDSLLLVIASENYEESDYIRSYEEFIKISSKKMEIMKYLKNIFVNTIKLKPQIIFQGKGR